MTDTSVDPTSRISYAERLIKKISDMTPEQLERFADKKAHAAHIWTMAAGLGMGNLALNSNVHDIALKLFDKGHITTENAILCGVGAVATVGAVIRSTITSNQSYEANKMLRSLIPSEKRNTKISMQPK